MDPITIAIVSMILIGLLFGVGLALASKTFHVDQDPRIEEVNEALPGINCGACGYRGCADYAEAVVRDGVPVDLCVPGAADTAECVAAIMGVTVEKKARTISHLHCQGSSDKCRQRFEYDGPCDCRAAVVAQNSPKACLFGCIGFGTCAEECPFDAITMGEDMLPVVSADKCTACGICVKVCPRNLYEILPASTEVYLGCSSQGKGKAVKDVCSVGCIACQKCVKVDPQKAITMNGSLPVLDYTKGSTFREAAEACPMSCFVVREEFVDAMAPAASAADGAD